MADLNSWEDDKDAQDENLAQQAQSNLNISNAQANTFRPGASSFQPGATSFQPGQQFQQYGAYPQYGQQYLNQGGYGGYPQYGQQGQAYGQYNQGYNQGYGQQGYGGQFGGYNQQQQQSFQQQPQQQNQQRQVPVIAKRPSGAEKLQEQIQEPAKPAPAVSTSSTEAPKAKVLTIGGDSAAKPKVLSIGADSSAKVETAGKSKVLSIGATTPASSSQGPVKPDAEKASAEEGAKVTAAKAIEKTGKGGAASPSDGKSSPTPSSGKNSPTPAETRAAVQADAVAQEQAADVDEETLAEMYGKEHVNVIFLGHVDAGKSTLGGSILYATGMVDERTMEKYKREAKEAGRETWYLSWALDLTKEERSKGKTVEVGRGFFETDKRRYSILDAPGHKTFVPNMIGGASQADVGCLVISARKGEYETGFEKGGQTREHAVLAKTQGVNKLVVVVNKMDDPTVEWSEERYKECITKLTVFLKGVGYNPKSGESYCRSYMGQR